MTFPDYGFHVVGEQHLLRAGYVPRYGRRSKDEVRYNYIKVLFLDQRSEFLTHLRNAIFHKAVGLQCEQVWRIVQQFTQTFVRRQGERKANCLVEELVERGMLIIGMRGVKREQRH